MEPIHTMAILLTVLGALLLVFGKRPFILFAGILALLGVGILNLIPSEQVLTNAVLLISGLAIAGGVIGIFVEKKNRLPSGIIGFLTGGAVTLAIFDSMGFSIGMFDYAVGLFGAILGMFLTRRYPEWAVVVCAALTGALLVTRGLQLFNSMMVGIIGTSIWIILALVSFLYQSQDMRAHNSPENKQSLNP